MKPILPSLKQKKRYLVFEIISKHKLTSFDAIASAIHQAVHQSFGEIGAARMGLMVLKEKFNPEKQKGIIKVNHTNLDELKASLAMITKVDRQKATFKSVGVSGIINKAQQKFITI